MLPLAHTLALLLPHSYSRTGGLAVLSLAGGSGVPSQGRRAAWLLTGFRPLGPLSHPGPWNSTATSERTVLDVQCSMCTVVVCALF